MRSRFKGHFGESPENLKKIWETAVFVFDANILLNFYRYSDSSRAEFLNVLNQFRDRIWLPARAADEYFSNRLNEIGKQASSYKSAQEKIETIQKEFSDTRRHPFISATAMAQLDAVVETIKLELNENKKIHGDRISNDQIMQSIADTFDGRLGENYPEDRLDEIFVEGKKRYDEKIPPGYMDANKTKDPTTMREKCGNYGDLIIWFQTIQMAVEKEVNVIFVTDDGKEDWWLESNGKTIGPRSELIGEFSAKTQKSFHMYKPEQFLIHANEHLKQNVSPATLEEVRETSQFGKLRERKDYDFNLHAKKSDRQASKIDQSSRLVVLENWLAQNYHVTEIRHEINGYNYVFSTFESPLTFGVDVLLFDTETDFEELADHLTNRLDDNLEPKYVDEMVFMLVTDSISNAKIIGKSYYSFFRGISDKLRVVVGVAHKNSSQGFYEFRVLFDIK